MNVKKQKVIKNMFTVSLIIFLVYLFITLFICLKPKLFLPIVSMAFQDEEAVFFNIYQFGGLVLTGVLFIPAFIISRRKVSALSPFPILCGIFNIIVGVLSCFAIPFITNMLSASGMIRQLSSGMISESTYSAYTAASAMVSWFDFLLFVAMGLFLCAYAIYWCDVCGKEEIPSAML